MQCPSTRLKNRRRRGTKNLRLGSRPPLRAFSPARSLTQAPTRRWSSRLPRSETGRLGKGRSPKGFRRAPLDPGKRPRRRLGARRIPAPGPSGRTRFTKAGSVHRSGLGAAGPPSRATAPAAVKRFTESPLANAATAAPKTPLGPAPPASAACPLWPCGPAGLEWA